MRAGLLAAACCCWFVGCSQEKTPAGKSFQDEPAAHKLYSQMVDTMRKATNLSWVSDYRWEARGQTLGHATYRIWLKKPNYARVEATRGGPSRTQRHPGGRWGLFLDLLAQGEAPLRHGRTNGKYAEEYEKVPPQLLHERADPGRATIPSAIRVGQLGAGIAMTILDPSTFHGYTDSLQPYLDGVRSVGTETGGW